MYVQGSTILAVRMLQSANRVDRKGFICVKKPIDTMIAWG
jgi:hypothetical protein